MNISIHAAQRFLERVMSKDTYTCIEVDFTMRFLKKLLQDVVPTSANKHFVIPGFESYRAIYRQNTIVTIIPKGEKYVR